MISLVSSQQTPLELEGMECGRIEMKMGNVNSSSDQRKIPDRPKSEIRNGERQSRTVVSLSVGVE
jgi:hypothetical protein